MPPAVANDELPLSGEDVLRSVTLPMDTCRWLLSIVDLTGLAFFFLFLVATGFVVTTGLGSETAGPFPLKAGFLPLFPLELDLDSMLDVEDDEDCLDCSASSSGSNWLDCSVEITTSSCLDGSGSGLLVSELLRFCLLFLASTNFEIVGFFRFLLILLLRLPR